MTEVTSSITRMLLQQLLLLTFVTLLYSVLQQSCLAPASSTPSKVFFFSLLPLCLFIFFLDLIRHGKHHNHHAKEEPSPSPTASRVARQQPQAESHPPHEIPHPREAAEIIVNEEREAKTKMPHYKGLENFKLIEKMGECVPQ